MADNPGLSIYNSRNYKGVLISHGVRGGKCPSTTVEIIREY